MYIIFLLITITFLFIVPAILKWLWNMTMPDLFALKEISYWQSFRLILISAILFSPGMVNYSA